MKRISAFVLAVLLFGTMLFVLTPIASNAAGVLSYSLVKTFFNKSQNSVTDTYKAKDGTYLPYRLYVPEDYDPEKSYPLVLFFHGAGEAGSDNEHIFRGGSILQRLLLPDERSQRPCIILAPQCGSTANGGKWVNSDWGPGTYDHTTFKKSPYMTAAEELLDKVIEEYSVDETSLYVSGISMGGYGTWDIISRNPDKFAAAIPVCGGIDESYMEGLKGMPIRTFHAADGTIVSNKGTVKANEILKDYGDFLYTEYATGGHIIWDRAYGTSGLTDWLFAQHTEPKTYNVSVENDAAKGTVEAPEKVESGGKLEFTVTAKDGYEIAGVRVDGIVIEAGENGKYTVDGIKADVQIQAEYTEKSVFSTTEPTEETPPATPADPPSSTSGKTTADEESGAPVVLIVFVVAAVAVLAGIAAFIVLKRKRK